MDNFLSFLTENTAEISTAIIAIASMVASSMGVSKSQKSEKRMITLGKTTQSELQITKEGIIEGFKAAKMNEEWKVSISNQVDKKLDDWSTKFLTLFEEHEKIRTELAIANTKILMLTQAYTALSAEDKEQIQEVISELGDHVIEV